MCLEKAHEKRLRSYSSASKHWFDFELNWCLLIKLDAWIVEGRPFTYSSISHFPMDISAQRKIFDRMSI